MRCTTLSNTRQQGFTLIEVLIVAPIALLVISGFVALMVTLTGDVLASGARTGLIQKTDSALERFEQDVRFTAEFRETGFTPSSPQGMNGTTQAFNVDTYLPDSDNNPLGTVRILRSYATDKNPLDASKKLIYTTSPTPSACGTITETQNNPLEYDIVYYLKQDSGTTASDIRMSLWRRIIFNPSQTACSGSTAWQKSTCTPGVTGTPCQAEDEKIIDNITSGGIGGYYAAQPDRTGTSSMSPSDGIDCILTCPDGYTITLGDSDSYNILKPNSASDENAEATYLFIKTKVTVAGRDAEYSGGVYARRLN